MDNPVAGQLRFLDQGQIIPQDPFGGRNTPDAWSAKHQGVAFQRPPIPQRDPLMDFLNKLFYGTTPEMIDEKNMAWHNAFMNERVSNAAYGQPITFRNGRELYGGPKLSKTPAVEGQRPKNPNKVE